MKKTVIWILVTGLILFCGITIITFLLIHRQVDRITTIAVSEFKKDAVESLTDLIKAENHSFTEKNFAIWAIGQFADRKALPFLEKLNAETGDKSPCDRKNELCKKEIEKAIKWCRNGNLTSWMYEKQKNNYGQ